MEDFDKIRDKIIDTLSDNPQGLTTSQICSKSGFSRVATAKYLEMLRLMGLVNYRHIGPSKLYTISDTAGFTYTVRGRMEVYKVWERMVKKAKKEIFGLTSMNGLIRMVRYRLNWIKEAKSRGIKFRLLAPVEQKNLEAAKELEPFVEIRHVSPVERIISYTVRDGESTLMVSTPSDDTSPDGEDVGIMMKADFARFMGLEFEKSWKSSIPLRERIKQL